MARQRGRGWGSASRLRVCALVIGVITVLAAAPVVSVAVARRSSAAHLSSRKSVAAGLVPVRTVEPATTTTAAGVTPVPTTPPTPATTSATTQAPTPTTTPAPPHFDTPQAAMNYLAAAWNAHDTVALGHVTTPAARSALDETRGEAVNLRLDHCERRHTGDYVCYFNHDYPSKTGTKASPGGHAVFLVEPALIPGWYMTVLQVCG